MNLKEVVFTLHLYSIDSDFKIPFIGEYGLETSNLYSCIASSWVEKVISIVHSYHADWHLETDSRERIISPLLIRLPFYDSFENPNYQFVVSFIVDSHPEEPRDLESCVKQKQMFENCEVGFDIWWLHHISMPNRERIDCDRITSDVEERVMKTIELELIANEGWKHISVYTVEENN